jgi:hypothetical protein
VVVRSVFKILKDAPPTLQDARSKGLEGNNCTDTRISPPDYAPEFTWQFAVRCELELPSTASSEEALKANVVNNVAGLKLPCACLALLLLRVGGCAVKTCQYVAA